MQDENEDELTLLCGLTSTRKASGVSTMRVRPLREDSLVKVASVAQALKRMSSAARTARVVAVKALSPWKRPLTVAFILFVLESPLTAAAVANDPYQPSTASFQSPPSIPGLLLGLKGSHNFGSG
jgi:hypothetical protein